MIVDRSSTGKAGVEAYLDDPNTCALYLTDALETCRPSEIAQALRDIQRANGSKVRSLNGKPDMSLAEIMEVLESAGIRLVAQPNSPAAPK